MLDNEINAIHYNCLAKINLFLKIISKRSDGYHEIESLFAFLDLYDELYVAKADGYHMEIKGEFAAAVDVKNNLLTKILDFFVSNFSVDKNLTITLVKNIPVGGGLGGGSSDAAFFIQALNKIFQLNLSKLDMRQISLKFGSDIAFFFENHAAIVRGRGEIITPLKSAFKPLYTLLVNPKIEISSQKIYNNFAANYSAKLSDAEIVNSDVVALIKNLSNDLTVYAAKQLLLIDQILSAIIAQNNCLAAKMTGSGSTCFGIFCDEASLDEAQSRLTKIFPDFFVRKSQILYQINA